MTKSNLQELQIAHRKLKRQALRRRKEIIATISKLKNRRWIAARNFATLPAKLAWINETLDSYNAEARGEYQVPDYESIVFPSMTGPEIDIDLHLITYRLTLDGSRGPIVQINDNGKPATYRRIHPDEIVAVHWRPVANWRALAGVAKPKPHASRCKISTPKER